VSNQDVAPSQVSVSKPVRYLGAMGVAATAAVTALAVIPGIPVWVPAAVGAMGLVMTVFVSKLTENNTTPWTDVAAKVTLTGEVIAGPAAEQKTGTTVEVLTPVDPPPASPPTDGL